MRPIVTDRAAWSVCLSVGLSVYTVVSPAKTAELIDLRFGFRTLVDTRNNVLDGVPHLPVGKEQF